MSKTLCPVGCGKKFISKECAAAHAKENHIGYVEGEVKRKGWRTSYGFLDFTEPVTYREAVEAAEIMIEKIKLPKL